MEITIIDNPTNIQKPVDTGSNRHHWVTLMTAMMLRLISRFNTQVCLHKPHFFNPWVHPFGYRPAQCGAGHQHQWLDHGQSGTPFFPLGWIQRAWQLRIQPRMMGESSPSMWVRHHGNIWYRNNGNHLK